MTTLPTMRERIGQIGVVTSMALTGLIVGLTITAVRGNRMAPWIVGRATGVCAFLLLAALVVVGLTLARPARRQRGGARPGVIRLHIALALFTTLFTAAHVVVLGTDRWAGVGWVGAAVPLGSAYRPWPVTLGLIALWIFLLAGVSAAVAGRLPGRLWRPLHHLGLTAFVLAWWHGFLVGVDTGRLVGLYAATGAAVVLTAASRWSSPARTGGRP